MLNFTEKQEINLYTQFAQFATEQAEQRKGLIKKKKVLKYIKVTDLGNKFEAHSAENRIRDKRVSLSAPPSSSS